MQRRLARAKAGRIVNFRATGAGCRGGGGGGGGGSTSRSRSRLGGPSGSGCAWRRQRCWRRWLASHAGALSRATGGRRVCGRHGRLGSGRCGRCRQPCSSRFGSLCGLLLSAVPAAPRPRYYLQHAVVIVVFAVQSPDKGRGCTSQRLGLQMHTGTDADTDTDTDTETDTRGGVRSQQQQHPSSPEMPHLNAVRFFLSFPQQARTAGLELPGQAPGGLGVAWGGVNQRAGER